MDGTASLPEGWQSAVDASTGAVYYFNPKQGISQWHFPGTVSPRDAAGHLQGPFTQEQLSGWRACLPMDLLVSYQDPADADGADTAIELAVLLGDEQLLRSWQHQYPGQPEGTAPPAPVWQHWMDPFNNNGTTVPASQQESSASKAGQAKAERFNAYAEAVLAGLPAHDEAVQLAALAAASGKSLADLVEFSWEASAASTRAVESQPAPPPVDAEEEAEAEDPDKPPPKVTAMRNPYSGRMQLVVEDGGSATLYKEMSRWCDPKQLEASLQDLARRKQQKVPPEVWKKLKEKKQLMKKKMRLL